MHLFIILLSHLCTSELWQKQQIPPLTFIGGNREIKSAFIGKQNQSIYIVGGEDLYAWEINDTWDWAYARYDLIEYNIPSQSFVSHPNNYSFMFQWGQSSVQIGNELFMLPFQWGSMPKNMVKLNMYTLNIENVTLFPGLSVEGRCMAHFGSHLIIIGGYSDLVYYSTNMYVFDLVLHKWSNGTSLPMGVVYHSCNVVHQTIYVFGGVTSDGTSSDISKLEIADPDNCCYGQWVKLNATLTSAKVFHRSVVVGTQIYIIGGDDYKSKSTSGIAEVDVFETQTNQVYPYSDLTVPRRHHAAVAINNVVYVFGGYRVSDNTYYEYNVVPTQSPTTSPSKTPTTITYNPTYNPSDYPTTNIPTSSSNADIIVTSVTVDGSGENGTAKTQDHSSSVLTALIVVFSVLILLLAGAIFWQRKTTSSKVDMVEANKNDKNRPVDDVVEMVNTEGNDIITKGNSTLVMSDSDDENKMMPATETTGNYDQHENDSDMNESEDMQVHTWLDSICLNEYCDTFVSNGFDSVNMVKEINGKHDLVDIGITLKAHQLKLMNHIQKLKYANTTATTTTTTATINTTK